MCVYVSFVWLVDRLFWNQSEHARKFLGIVSFEGSGASRFMKLEISWALLCTTNLFRVCHGLPLANKKLFSSIDSTDLCSLRWIGLVKIDSSFGTNVKSLFHSHEGSFRYLRIFTVVSRQTNPSPAYFFFFLGRVDKYWYSNIYSTYEKRKYFHIV